MEADADGVVDWDELETEVVKGAQLSLSEGLFRRYNTDEVQVSVSFSQKMDLAELKQLFAGQPLEPGAAVQVVLNGYVAGAGLKWKPDGEGKSATLSIVADKMVEPEDDTEA